MANLSVYIILTDALWLILLVSLFIHFWHNRQTLLDAQGWLKTKGHITQYQLVQWGSRLWPKIEYEYSVYEKNLIGHYLFLDTTHNSPNSKYARQVAYDAAIAYRDQCAIEVYYNPNRPEESALDVTMPIKLSIILIVLGLLIAAQSVRIFWHLLG